MKEIRVKVKFEDGLHARPAVTLIKLAAKFESEITLEKNEKRISVNGIMTLLGACIVCGDDIIIRAEGNDEEQAIHAMEEFFA